MSKAPAKRQPHTPAQRAKTNVRPPTPGPGRPRKPTAPRTEQQAALAEAINATETERDAAALAYASETTVAVELRLLRAELAVSSAWSSYCRAQGNHTHALRYSEVQTKLAGRLVALREIESVDRLGKLTERSEREDALAKRAGR